MVNISNFYVANDFLSQNDGIMVAKGGKSKYTDI